MPSWPFWTLDDADAEPDADAVSDASSAALHDATAEVTADPWFVTELDVSAFESLVSVLSSDSVVVVAVVVSLSASSDAELDATFTFDCGAGAEVPWVAARVTAAVPPRVSAATVRPVAVLALNAAASLDSFDMRDLLDEGSGSLGVPPAPGGRGVVVSR